MIDEKVNENGTPEWASDETIVTAVKQFYSDFGNQEITFKGVLGKYEEAVAAGAMEKHNNGNNTCAYSLTKRTIDYLLNSEKVTVKPLNIPRTWEENGFIDTILLMVDRLNGKTFTTESVVSIVNEFELLQGRRNANVFASSIVGQMVREGIAAKTESKNGASYKITEEAVKYYATRSQEAQPPSHPA